MGSREMLSEDYVSVSAAKKRGIWPALGLVFLAPLVAEYLLGNLPIKLLPALIVLAPMYGGGALLMPCGRCRQVLLEHGGPDMPDDDALEIATVARAAVADPPQHEQRPPDLHEGDRAREHQAAIAERTRDRGREQQTDQHHGE